MWPSHFRRKLPPSTTRTRKSSTAFCSKPQPRRSRRLPAIPSISEPRSVSPPSYTLGVRRSPIIPTSIASCREVGSRQMEKALSHARPAYFLPERVLSRLVPGVFLGKLAAASKDGRLHFVSDLAHLAVPRAFSGYLAPLWRLDWVVDSKRPFAGPEQVLRYLSRYTHRVAISDHRLVEVSDDHVTFTWKDYSDDARIKPMTLAPAEFIRRFLLHVLPDGFQRIRHYGFLANGNRQTKLARIRQLLPPTAQQQIMCVTQGDATAVIPTEATAASSSEGEWQPICSACGNEMAIVEVLPKAPRNGVARIDTS